MHFGLPSSNVSDAVRLAITLADYAVRPSSVIHCVLTQRRRFKQPSHEVPTWLEFCSPGSLKALSFVDTSLREQLHASVRSAKSSCVQALPQSKDIAALGSARSERLAGISFSSALTARYC